MRAKLLVSSILVLVPIFGLWLFTGPFPGQWAAFILWIVWGHQVTTRLWPRLGITARNRIREIGIPSILGAITAAVYAPFAMGKMPWMADHLVHQARAFTFLEQLLKQGRLTGWTHFVEAGIPGDTLYPPFVDIYLSFIHLLTFGLGGWETTYAIGFFLFLLMYVGTFYALGRRFGGPWAGFVAGFLALVDRGAFRQGGWSFMVEWGVWPLSFSLILALWSLHWFDRHFSSGRGLSRGVFFGALALCTHPFAFFLVFPMMLLLAVVHGGQGQDFRTLGIRLATAATLTFMAAAWWLVPFMAYGPGWSAPVSALSGNLQQVASGMVDGNLWGAPWVWATVPGMLGMFWMLKLRTSSFLTALTLYSLGILALGSTSVLAGLNLFEHFPALSHLQFPRFLIVVKACAFLTAGWFFTHLKMEPDDGENQAPGVPDPARNRIFAWVLVPLAALLAFPVVQKVVESQLLPLTDYHTEPGLKNDISVIASQLKAHARTRNTFFRVAIDGHFHEHRTSAIVAATGLPYVKLSYMPAETFIHATHEHPGDVPRSVGELQKLQAAYVVSLRPSRLPDLKLLSRSGELHLYEFRSYRPERHELVAPSGEVAVTRFDNEFIRMSVTGLPDEGGLLRVHVAPFVRWEARVNGKVVPIWPWQTTPRLTLMEIPVKNGIITLTYVKRWPDRLGWILTGLVLAFFLLFRVLPRRWRPRFSLDRCPLRLALQGMRIRDRMASFLMGIWKQRAVQVTLAVLGLAGLVIFAWWLRTPSRKQPFSLHRARVSVISRGDRQICRYAFPERFICGRGHRHVSLEMREIGKKPVRAFWAHPETDSTIRITFPAVRITGPLKVHAGLADTSQSTRVPVTLQVFFDDRKVAETSRIHAGHWEPLMVPVDGYLGTRVDIRFDIGTTNATGRHFLFMPAF